MKIFKGVVLSLLLLNLLGLQAQTVFAFTNTYGSTGSHPYSLVVDAAGNIYTANYVDSNVSKITPAGGSSIFATTGANPMDIIMDEAGNLYTANNNGTNNVSKITPEGVSTILATTGSNPSSITIDSAGNIYTANNGSNNVSKITPEGVSTIVGTTGSHPKGIILDAAGNIYTANTYSDNVSKITPEGVSTIFGTTGSLPIGIVMDSDGNIYTANNGSNNVSKITPEGVSTIVGTIELSPQAIAIDGNGNIYTANATGYSSSISKITPEGVLSLVSEYLMYNPISGITIDTNGNVYTSNYGDRHITKISNPTITEVTPVPNPVTSDDEISYTFNSNSPSFLGYVPLAISISYGGDCSSNTTDVVWGNNTVVFNPLSSGLHNNCTISITDEFGTSNTLLIPEFSVEESHNTIVTSETYTISTMGGGSETITDVPFGTSKVDFLLNLTKGNESQTWDDTNISDLVFTDDTLIVTAEDGETTATYTITVDPALSNNAAISSSVYTITIDGEQGTINNVPFNTSQADFLANLTMGNENQSWYYQDKNVLNDPIEEGDTLRVVSEDGDTEIIYTVIVNAPEPTIFWYKTGANTNWNTLSGNWWTNEAHTEQAEELPTSVDVVKTLGTVGPLASVDTWTEPYSIDATATGIYLSGTSSISAEMFGNVTFNDEVSNSSNITGNAIFYNSTQNDGIITGNAIFYNNSVFLSGSVTGNATFYDESALHNNGEVDGLATFNDNSTNGSFSTVNGDAIFNDSSVNQGPVLGNATFNDESYNDDIVSGNAIFNDTTINYGTVEGNACFRDESINEGDVEGELVCPGLVNTLNASITGKTYTNLNASVIENEESDITERGFEYGVNTNYGNSVSELLNDDEIFGVGEYFLSITGLTCNTTYHYRAYIVNPFDTNYGDDVTFTTSSCSNSSSGGGKPSRPKVIFSNLVTCPPGHKYNTQSGQLCTVFTSNSNPVIPTTCLITLTLRQGNRGEQVKCLQTKLNITSDGVFGSMTKAAVILLQKAHNLVPDGVVGPMTRGVL